jgi:hypothetical protein
MRMLAPCKCAPNTGAKGQLEGTYCDSMLQYCPDEGDGEVFRMVVLPVGMLGPTDTASGLLLLTPCVGVGASVALGDSR